MDGNLVLCQGLPPGVKGWLRSCLWLFLDFSVDLFGDSLGAAEDREGWKAIVATSSAVPRRPPRLRD